MRCSCIQTDNIQSGLLPLRPILSDPINHCPIRPNPIQHAKHFLIRIWSYPYYHMSSHPARSEPIRLATEPYSSEFAIECGYTAPYIVQAQKQKHILAHVLSRPQLWWHPPPQPKAEVEPSTRTTMRKITTIMITTAITIRANTIARNTILATCTVHTDTHTHTQNHKHTVQSPQYTICSLISRCKNELKQRETTATTAKWEKNKHSQQKHLSIKQPEKFGTTSQMNKFDTPSRNSKTTLTHNATYGCSCDRDRKRNEKAQLHRTTNWSRTGMQEHNKTFYSEATTDRWKRNCKTYNRNHQYTLTKIPLLWKR